MPSNDITRSSESLIEVFNLPGPANLGIIFPTSSCFTSTGLQGARQIPVSVNVSVTNFPGNCSDTLFGAFSIEPFDTACVVSSGIALSDLVFPAANAGSTSTDSLIISETTGASDLVVNSLTLTGQFFFDIGCTQPSMAGPLTVLAGTGSAPIPVYFCPNLDNGALYVGNLTVLSNAPTSPTAQTLSGQEAFPILVVTPSSLSYTTSPSTQSFTLANTGTGDLSWSTGATGTGFAITSPTSGTVTPGNFTSVDVQYSGGSGSSNGLVVVSVTEPDAQGSPATVTLTATVP
jgi:hypothetical protein